MPLPARAAGMPFSTTCARNRFGHVSGGTRVLSGPGLGDLYRAVAAVFFQTTDRSAAA